MPCRRSDVDVVIDKLTLMLDARMIITKILQKCPNQRKHRCEEYIVLL